MTTVPLEEQEKLIVCTFCTSENIKNCLKCKRPFCVIHSSHVSPNFCKECFNNLQAINKRFIRTVEDYDSSTDTMTTRRESCDQLMLDGPDYVFYTAWINTLNDDELKLSFEFHYFIVKQIEHANEIRKIEHSQKLRGMPLPISTITTTETKTERKVKVKDPRAELRKLGIPEATIDVMLKAAGEVKS